MTGLSTSVKVDYDAISGNAMCLILGDLGLSLCLPVG